MAKFEVAHLFEHWPAKVLAVAAALLLFLFNRFDSLQTKSFTIPLRLMTDTALVPSKAWTNRIKVTLRGNEEVLSGLTEADFEVMADFSSYQSEGVRREPVQVVRRKSLTETEALEVQVGPGATSSSRASRCFPPLSRWKVPGRWWRN